MTTIPNVQHVLAPASAAVSQVSVNMQGAEAVEEGQQAAAELEALNALSLAFEGLAGQEGEGGVGLFGSLWGTNPDNTPDQATDTGATDAAAAAGADTHESVAAAWGQGEAGAEEQAVAEAVEQHAEEYAASPQVSEGEDRTDLGAEGATLEPLAQSDAPAQLPQAAAPPKASLLEAEGCTLLELGDGLAEAAVGLRTGAVMGGKANGKVRPKAKAPGSPLSPLDVEEGGWQREGGRHRKGGWQRGIRWQRERG